jgi:transketolase
LKLGKLIAFFDDNGISIDGDVKGWCADDTPARFEAYGWQVIRAVDGHDAESIATAIRTAIADTERPTLICCRTIIGFGAPHKQGTKNVHGEALGAVEVAAARETLGWKYPPFEIPQDIRDAWDQHARGRAAREEWAQRQAAWVDAYPDLAIELTRRLRSKLPRKWNDVTGAVLQAALAVDKPQATRASSQVMLDVLGPALSEMVGGSADLTGSNNTFHKASKAITPQDFTGNYINYGVREFAMTAMMNGMALHGGFHPYAGTFLVFSDYARNAVRMAALMHQPVTLVYTHDSIGLGEDGPTHQPIEHVSALRVMPSLSLWRPCDALETAQAWLAAVERRTGPTALVLTRQALPQQPRTREQQQAVHRGGYVLIEPAAGAPEALVIATGSEVPIAAEAVNALNAAGRRVRLVSMPSTDVFDHQDAAWRAAVLPPSVTKRVAVEAGATALWWKYVGSQGRVIGIDRFGASGKAPDLYKHFGLTAEHIRQVVGELIN